MKPTKPVKSLTTMAVLGLALGMFAAGNAQGDSFGSGANSFAIDFVTIGDPGNPNDSTTYGGVDSTFRISAFEVSRQMINKANALGNLDLTLANMSSFGGNGDDRPATGISWNEAARFVNWLNLSKGHSVAYKFTLQPGDAGYNPLANIELWGVDDPGYNPNNPYRNSNAFYFLPSEDEWYKAAYYSGTGDVYFDYATGSNTAPTPVGSGTDSGTAVYSQPVGNGPADINNAGGLSPYGTMAQNGNVWEWTESAFSAPNSSSGENRSVRGGAWAGSSSLLISSNRFTESPTLERNNLGFRVASVPEPSSALLLVMAGSAWLLRRRSKRST